MAGYILTRREGISVLVNLTGDVPTVSATGKKTIVKVGEYNGGNEVYPGSAVIREANVILPGSPAVPALQPHRNSTLLWPDTCGNSHHTGKYHRQRRQHQPHLQPWLYQSGLLRSSFY